MTTPINDNFARQSKLTSTIMTQECKSERVKVLKV